MQDLLADGTLFWGVAVERVEVKDVRVPEQLMRAMAAEAEAARLANAKVVAAEGEHRASRSLHLAANSIKDKPAALQVRCLTRISSSSSQLIIPAEISASSHQCFNREQQNHSVSNTSSTDPEAWTESQQSTTERVILIIINIYSYSVVNCFLTPI